MIEIRHIDLMRTINHHRLDVISEPFFEGKKLTERWKLRRGYGYELVAVEHSVLSGGRDNTKTTECSEAFYEKYVKTTPDDVLHCSTCAKAGSCPIERKDKYDYCFGWKKNTEN